MRKKTLMTVLVAGATLAASLAGAGTWEGTLKLGGVILDEEGDLSTVQETYNIHDGFSISQILLTGTPGSGDYLRLDLREINLDGRRAKLLYRKPGSFKLTGSFDQHRQVFDPARGLTSDRKDWNFGAQVTAAKWLRLGGNLNYLSRDGDRMSFPSGTVSGLGTQYDYATTTGRISADARKNGRGIGLDYRVSSFTDELNTAADRTGRVFSARAYSPCKFYDKLTNLFRGVYGVSELSDGDVDYTLTGFQYTGVLRPVDRFQFKYNFDAQRVDNTSTNLKTDRFQNNFDATVYHANGSVSGGYGYETNDNDRTLTANHRWRLGTSFRGSGYSARLRYAGRVKKDTEELTLLKDVEESRFRADLETKPVQDLTLGFGLNIRDREFPDIEVEAQGQMARASAAYTYEDWGRVSGTYTYSSDEYVDLAAGYDVKSHAVTARADLEKIKNLRLSSGVTFFKASEDLDIEKSIVFFEGLYDVSNDLHLESKYNVYNYDDFILLDRYYTANVVWLNIAYDIHGK